MSEESTKKDRARRKNNEPTTCKDDKRNDKRPNLQAVQLLKNKHPELFEITPLAGHYHRHRDSRQSENDNFNECKSSESKKLTPPPTRTRARDRANIGDILETTIRCPSANRSVSKDDRKNDTVRMCSVAISTVMMLAQKTYDDITMEHVRHTQEYFRGLKQPDGYPVNVGQLMKLLTNLNESGKIVSSVEDQEDSEEETEKGQETGEESEYNESPMTDEK